MFQFDQWRPAPKSTAVITPLALCHIRLFYNSALKGKRAAKAILLLLLLLPVPALIAPYVSDDPIHWAYRDYHPFMYRYPVVLGVHAALDLETRSREDWSLELLRLVIKYW